MSTTPATPEDKLHRLGARHSQLTSLAVGPWHTAEFATAVANVGEEIFLQHYPDVEQACNGIAYEEIVPELILVAQSLPGAVRQHEVDRLQQLAPLARIVVVAGTWCEGELRTGRPPNGVLRLYWYELATWWQAAQRRWSIGLCPAWSAPLDHPQAGRFAIDSTIDGLSLPGVVAIDSADYAVFECLADALGASAIWARNDGSLRAAAGIWDGGQLNDLELHKLTHFCRQVTGPVVALLDFPRVEHFAAARAAGAAAVFAKPYVIEEVLAALN